VDAHRRFQLLRWALVKSAAHGSGAPVRVLPARNLARLFVVLALLLPLLGQSVSTAHAAIVNLAVTGVAIQAQEGVPFISTIAACPDPNAGPYTALVDWGDGVTNNGGFSTVCSGSVYQVSKGVHCQPRGARAPQIPFGPPAKE
jgi:hypothetical protein